MTVPTVSIALPTSIAQTSTAFCVTSYDNINNLSKACAYAGENILVSLCAVSYSTEYHPECLARTHQSTVVSTGMHSKISHGIASHTRWHEDVAMHVPIEESWEPMDAVSVSQAAMYSTNAIIRRC